VDTVAQDLAALGVQGAELPDWMLELAAEDDFGVLPENWDAVNLFLACTTQWLREVVSDGKHTRSLPLGLRYEGVDVVLRRSCILDPDDAFARLRVMEMAALREFRRIAAED